VVPTVAASVDIVVHLASDGAGHRWVREVVGVSGRVERDVIETSDIFSAWGGRLERAEGYPPHPERFEAAGIDLVSALGHRIVARVVGEA
jgi:pilus assembly protein CpaF